MGVGRLNIATKVPLSKTNYDAATIVPLSIVADDSGPSGNNIRVIVEIGTAANPTTGEKGVESVSVVDNVITVVTYSEGATWQSVADAINADTEASALVDVEATPATAGNDAVARNFSLSGSKGVPALEDNTNARLVDVEGGWIYPDDADAIRFEATAGLRVDLSAGEADIIVVPTGNLDGNGVRIGEVRLLTSDETPPEEYYVIGTTGNLSATATDTVATAVLEIDGVEYLRFTSDKAGAGGNGQEIRFEFSNNPVGGISSSVDVNGVITIKITSTAGRNTVIQNQAKSVDDLIDVEYIGVLKDAGFFDANLFDGRVITITLSGGEDFVQTTPTPSTGTEVSTPEVLTWQETITKTHDYQINLDNIDEVNGEADEGTTEATAGATGTAPTITLDVTGHTKVSGNGSIGNTTATTPQFLVGGDPAQTIDNGTAGDVILGGKGSDNIRLERVGTTDIVIYRYDGENKSNLATQDGSDTINSFEVGKDILVLAHLEGTGSSFNTAAEFFEALKGVSLLVSSGENIDSIVFTFTDRDTPTQDIDLRINFFANVDSSNLDATFNVADSLGKRTIKTGQETAAYEVINQVFGESLALIDFADIGFEL